MAKKNYNERNRRSVVDIIKSGKIIDIFRNPNNNNLAAVLDGTYLGIDNRLKEIVESVADGDAATKRAAFKKLATESYYCELQECDENKQPVVTGVDPTTGKATYAQFVPCLVMNTMSGNIVARLDASLLDD